MIEKEIIMEKKTLFDEIGTLGLSLLINDVKRDAKEAIEKLEKSEDIRSIYGIVAVIADDLAVSGQKVMKVVSERNEEGAWDKNDGGIYIKIPAEKAELYSTPLSDVFIGDRVMVTLCPDYCIRNGTDELECFCYDMRVGSGWALEDGSIADFEEKTEQCRKEEEKKEKRAASWANLGLLFSIVAFLIGLTSLPSAICGMIGVVLGIRSMLEAEAKKNNAAILIGGTAIMAWVIVLIQ